MAEPDTGNAKAADAAPGSADNGGQHAGNADVLSNAFAGAGGGKPADKPTNGDAAAGGTETAGGLQTGKLPPWTEQLAPETRGNPDLAGKLAKFQKVGDLAKAYLELEGKAAGVNIPGKDAAPEALAAFWEQAGKPKTADDYSFAKDKERDGGTFAQAAFAANLTEAQAAAMLKGLSDVGELKAKSMRETVDRQAAETAAALEKEYGARYREKIELLSRGLAAAGPNVGALLKQAGLHGNREIVKAFITFGQMTAESGAGRGGGAGEPLKSYFDGGSLTYKDEENSE